jgi:excisionase family DNA binding protein
MITDSYLRAEDAGAMFNVTGETVRRLHRDGVIPAYRVGRYLRFDPEELREAFRTMDAKPRTREAAHHVAPDFDALDVS